MATAKVTSKGQITIPIEVRKRLGVEAGDTVVFETQAEYVTVKRQQTAHEYFSALREKYPTGPAEFDDDDEAIAAYFRTHADDYRPTGPLYELRFTRESIDAAIGDDDATG